MRECIVLTGAAGRLGQALRPYLSTQCAELRLVDRAPMTAAKPNEKVFQIDLNDEASLERAVQGASAVVHFAGYPREAEWDVLLPANIEGTIKLWDQAHAAGVDRVIYATSNHAVGLYPRDTPLAELVHPLPDSRYGLTKVFMEALASLYAIKHGVRGFGLRIGHCAQEPSDARMLSHWIHPEDLAALVTVGLTANYDNEIVYGASGNSRSWWPNARAFELGYRPTHSADGFAEQLEARVSDDPVAERYQGGSFAASEFTNARAAQR
ncbi:NAD(P)-dependent oxidoreductase [Variovorax sp. J22G73]|nr:MULTISPECIES: NAD(P)-dependent oxidoreductase [unclassified Variovorax]MDM0010616.1 NAD(P)-dependent oxidoreductase [Variovorax sp. J22R203]MDM0103056.1 NAD(P)-dependent oxidoreductase [Variovorax sp. J22G73]